MDWQDKCVKAFIQIELACKYTPSWITMQIKLTVHEAKGDLLFLSMSIYVLFTTRLQSSATITRDQRAAASSPTGPRKTRPCLTERLFMGRKDSNQTNKQCNNPMLMMHSETVIHAKDICCMFQCEPTTYEGCSKWIASWPVSRYPRGAR